MTFIKALKELRNENKVKRKKWNSYWSKGKDIYGECTVIIHNEDGTISDLRDIEDLFFLLSSIFACDWVVVDEKA